MTIGAAIFITAVGAILRFAVTGDVSGIDIHTVGTILIVAGIVGLLIGIALEFSARGRRTAATERVVERDRDVY
ncbi:MAG: DUF6458 family protein [Thermoleophilaceae bacterium]